MNHKVSYTDYVQNGIYETNEPVDEDEWVYPSFTKAKNKLLECLRKEKEEIEIRISEIKQLKKNDISLF